MSHFIAAHTEGTPDAGETVGLIAALTPHAAAIKTIRISETLATADFVSVRHPRQNFGACR